MLTFQVQMRSLQEAGSHRTSLWALSGLHMLECSVWIFVFSWLEHWHPSQFPWGRTNFFLTREPLSDFRWRVWIASVLGSFSLFSFSLTYQLKCPKHLPASFAVPLLLSHYFPQVCFFFSKVKHRSFCFMLHQLSGLPPFTSYHQLEQMEKNTFAKMGLTQAAHPCWLSGYPLQGRQCEFL